MTELEAKNKVLADIIKSLIEEDLLLVMDSNRGALYSGREIRVTENGPALQLNINED